MSKITLHKQIEALCIGPNVNDTQLHEFMEACILHQDFITCIIPNPHQISTAVKLLADSGIGVVGAIAYPLGNLAIEVKRVQIEAALDAGAKQIDILMRIESLNAGDYTSARQEAEALCQLAAYAGAQVSLIANLSLLGQAGKIAAARIAQDCQAILKTASGMGVDTELEDVQRLHQNFGADLKITACGNIHLAEQAIDMLHTGAERICTPAPFFIIAGLEMLRKHVYLEE